MDERRTDFELLRDFARAGDQPAFASLARRHVNLVYATAVRKVQDAGAAEEVAQNVFLALARKAWQFARDDSLAAWLYRATLLESNEWIRRELRRQRREQTAAELSTTMSIPDEQPSMNALLPLLDEALLSLREKDRAALLLRFYEDKSLRALGASLGIGEDAAQKRVATALQRLAAFFQRRGFKSATAASATAALQHTVVSAPAFVVTSVSQAAAHMTSPAISGVLAVASRWASLTRLQTAITCIGLAVLPVSWQLSKQRRAVAEFATARINIAATEQDYSSEQLELQRLRRLLTALEGRLQKATEAAQQRSERARQFEAWKNGLRAMLTADAYHWPDDSPFVRIPKSVLGKLNVHRPISPPGVLRREAREFLGLAPEERQNFEETLQKHFAAMDRLIEDAVVETNSTMIIPNTALASKAWVVAPLGKQVKTSVEELQDSLANILGDERWSMVKAQLEFKGRLHRVRCSISRPANKHKS